LRSDATLLVVKEYFDHVRGLERAWAAALERTGFDAALVHSGSLVPKTTFDDQDWPLRPTPHFQHFIPLAEPDVYLVVRSGRRTTLLRPSATSFWETRPEPPAAFFFEAFDVVSIETWERAKDHVPQGRVAFVGEREEKSLGLPRDAGLLAALDAIRTKKTPYEIACIAEANAVAARGHEAVRAAFEGGETNELRLHLLFLQATAQDDPETPYKNIVASGKNAATLHHVTYRKDASGSPSLLVDAGATHFGYCSDVTRTHVRAGGGAASETFAALASAVDAMQRRLCAAIRAGERYEALHDESHRQTSAILRDLGVVRDLSPEAIDAKGISRAFYPHGLGHSLGLQTHDVGCATTKPRADNPFLRNTSIIEPGQVFTIEPGVYFIESLLGPLRQGELAKYVDWALVDRLAPLGGVRVEDDVHVETGGIRNFTREVVPR
jgi:Xaa-Pro dipeptidase